MAMEKYVKYAEAIRDTVVQHVVAERRLSMEQLSDLQRQKFVYRDYIPVGMFSSALMQQGQGQIEFSKDILRYGWMAFAFGIVHELAHAISGANPQDNHRHGQWWALNLNHLGLENPEGQMNPEDVKHEPQRWEPALLEAIKRIPRPMFIGD